jgi:hypothetical protein
MVRIQNRERIHGFERRRLCRVANIAERTCFVGNMATLQLRFDDGEWPSGKAPGSGPGIRGFESLFPSHEKMTHRLMGRFSCLRRGNETLCDCALQAQIGVRGLSFAHRNLFRGRSENLRCHPSSPAKHKNFL